MIGDQGIYLPPYTRLRLVSGSAAGGLPIYVRGSIIREDDGREEAFAIINQRASVVSGIVEQEVPAGTLVWCQAYQQGQRWGDPESFVRLDIVSRYNESNIQTGIVLAGYLGHGNILSYPQQHQHQWANPSDAIVSMEHTIEGQVLTNNPIPLTICGYQLYQIELAYQAASAGGTRNIQFTLQQNTNEVAYLVGAAQATAGGTTRILLTHNLPNPLTNITGFDTEELAGAYVGLNAGMFMLVNTPAAGDNVAGLVIRVKGHQKAFNVL